MSIPNLEFFCSYTTQGNGSLVLSIYLWFNGFIKYSGVNE